MKHYCLEKIKHVIFFSVLCLLLFNIDALGGEIDKPKAFNATNITDSSFLARWSSVTGADHYKIFVNQQMMDGMSVGWIIMDKYDGLVVNDTSFTVSHLEQNSSYEYWVVAVDGTQDSEASNTVSCFTLPAPTETTGATNIARTSFTANWKQVGWASSYILRVSRDSNQSIIISGLEVIDTSYTITGLNKDAGYRYAVKVKTSPWDLQGIPAQESKFSNWTLVKTNPDLVPPAASNAKNITPDSFTAKWKGVEGASSYKLYVLKKIYIGGLPQWMYLINYNGILVSNTELEVVSLSTDIQYKYYVTAYNEEEGETDTSNEVVVETLLPAPIAEEASAATDSSFTAHWSVVNGAVNYELYVLKKAFIGGTPQWMFLLNYNGISLEQTEKVVTGLSPLSEYKYYVNAAGNNATSVESNEILVTTENISAPIALEAMNITDSSFSANWETVAKATQYRFYVLKKVYIGGTPQWMYLANYNGILVNKPEKEVTHLSPDTQYKYYLTAFFTEDIESTESDTIMLSTLPVPEYELSLQCNPANAGTLSGQGTYARGTSITLRADEAEGYDFINWTNDGEEVSINAEYTFAIDSNMVLTANFESTATQVERSRQKSIIMFPNPVTDNLTITGLTPNRKISVFSTTGMTMMERNTDKETINIPFVDVKPGIYFIRIEEQKGIFIQQVVVK